MSDRIDRAIAGPQPGQKVAGLKFETRTKSGLPVVVLISVNATADDLLELVADLCRELPAALAKARSGSSILVARALPTTKN